MHVAMIQSKHNTDKLIVIFTDWLKCPRHINKISGATNTLYANIYTAFDKQGPLLCQYREEYTKHLSTHHHHQPQTVSQSSTPKHQRTETPNKDINLPETLVTLEKALNLNKATRSLH
eukprot:13239682-Ditylum_brightwellii.AAC.1